MIFVLSGGTPEMVSVVQPDFPRRTTPVATPVLPHLTTIPRVSETDGRWWWDGCLIRRQLHSWGVDKLLRSSARPSLAFP